MLYELKVPYKNAEELQELIEGSYDNGVLKNTNNKKLIINSDDSLYELLKGRPTVKLLNDIVSGTMRFSIKEEGDILELYPCNIYQIIENDGYSFY